MKEVKPKPLAKLNEEQLRSFRSIGAQKQSLGDQLATAYTKEQELWDRLLRTFKLPRGPHYYISSGTGELFDKWPED